MGKTLTWNKLTHILVPAPFPALEFCRYLSFLPWENLGLIALNMYSDVSSLGIGLSICIGQSRFTIELRKVYPDLWGLWMSALTFGQDKCHGIYDAQFKPQNSPGNLPGPVCLLVVFTWCNLLASLVWLHDKKTTDPLLGIYALNSPKAKILHQTLVI